MAKQKGIFKVRGSLDDINFYKTKDGHLVREKGGVDAKRIKTDPAFQRTRENGQEFGTAGKGGQLIRRGFRLLMRLAKDGRVTSRLTQQLMQVVKTDTLNTRGNRTIQDGNMQLLANFDFNTRAKLESIFYKKQVPTYDRATGDFELVVSEFKPQEFIEAPQGTTHIQIVAGLCAIDFVERTFEEAHDRSAIIPWDMDTHPDIILSAEIPENSPHPVVQVVGVNYYQDVNGEMYPLKNGTHNSLAIVSVDQL